MMPCVLLLVATAVVVAANAQQEGHHCLLQAKARRSKYVEPHRNSITKALEQNPMKKKISSQQLALLVRSTRRRRRRMQKAKPEHPDYHTVHVTMPWKTGGQPLVRCPPAGQKAPPQGLLEADANLRKAVDIFCQVGLDPMVEFYVDRRFKSNYERLKGPDGWIEKAFVTYMGLHKGKDKIGAEEDLLVQSVHHFSKYPVVLTNFGRHVPKHISPELFPNLVLMHSRGNAASIDKDFNFNKLTSMMFTKVKGGVVLDADEFVSHGVNVMMERAIEGTTKEYPYPILPVHWMSRDPESDDMKYYPPGYTFNFVSKEAPRRTMRWGHAHPTWTHYALPWLARWSSYVLAPKKANAPAWLREQPYVADEDLLNFASWADGLDRQWCKFDLPGNELFLNYLGQRNMSKDFIRKDFNKNDTIAALGVDSKYFPKGIPLMFLTSHDGKEPQKSYHWLSRLWERAGYPNKTIYYDGNWFASGKALREYDPLLNCVA